MGAIGALIVRSRAIGALIVYSCAIGIGDGRHRGPIDAPDS